MQEAAALYQQVVQLNQQGRFNDAIPLAQRLVSITEKALGSEHPDTATVLQTLAVLYREASLYTQAESLARRSLGIYEKVLGPEHPYTAVALDNLAELYHRMGSYMQAEPLARRALAINERVLGPEHSHTGKALNFLAALHHSTGAFAEAESLYRRGLAIAEKVLGPNHEEVALSLNNLATAYYQTGAYSQAEPLYLRALAIIEKTLGSAHPKTAVSLNNLGLLYVSTGNYEQAEPLYREALGIREQALGPEHPATALGLNNLAGLYLEMGAYAQAEPLARRALAIRGRILGPDHPDTAQSLNVLASLYKATGAYTQAEPLFQRSLTIRERALGPEHPATATALCNLAVLRWCVGDHEAALSLLEQEQAIETKIIARFLLTSAESRKRAYLAQVRGSTFVAVSLSVAMTSQRARVLGLRSVLEMKGRLLDAMSDSVGRLRQSVKSEHRALLEQLVAVAQQMSNLMYQGPGALSPEAYRQQSDGLSSTQAQLEAELSLYSAEFRQQVAPSTVAAIQAVIPKQAVLIEWYRFLPYDPKAKDEKTKWGNPRYAAYVLRQDGEPAVVDVGDAETIEHVIRDFGAALSDPTSTHIKDLAIELFGLLMTPLRQLIGDAEHLLISPDGALNVVPFAALWDESDTYIAMRYEITYLTSGRDLVRFGTSATNSNASNAVVVADPDFGSSAMLVDQASSTVSPARSCDLDRGGMIFTPLPGTAAEAQALTPLLKLKKEHLLTQAQATEAKVKQLHGPRILHIATHGFFLKDQELPAAALRGSFSQDQPAVPLGENPLLRSGLALAGANLRRSGVQDDGILTAAEVAQMDLRGTQLVVLSACETGLGEVQNGEGVYGLRRALVLAGAETQVVSLWKVPDEATKDLMIEYYQRLLRGVGRSAALRAAQQTMITSEMCAHPFYWAAFVPIGRWTSLTQKQ